MLNDQEKCDVTIKIRRKEIKCHSLILATRSPILGLAFKHPTTEKEKKLIVIEDDCDEDTFEEYINYLYTGVLKIDTPMKGTEHYVIAHKYNCNEIKKFCVKYLVENICTENVCNLVEFSLKYDEELLNRRAKDYFNQNVSDILESEEWAEFIARDPILATTLLKNMTKCRLLE